MTDKCIHHKGRKRRLYQRIFACLLVTIFIVLLAVLIIWAVLQPKKPKFVLQDATVFTLNATSPNVVTTTFQVTVMCRNSNDKIGIYYDKLDAYASYNDQQITLDTSIPPTYQGHKETNIWSPFLSGIQVPVAPYNGISLANDVSNGVVQLVIKIFGRVRFKVGAYTSGHYRLHVKCPAMITLGSRSTGISVGNAVKYQLYQKCSVSL